jgi:hypothetical protein
VSGPRSLRASMLAFSTVRARPSDCVHDKRKKMDRPAIGDNKKDHGRLESLDAKAFEKDLKRPRTPLISGSRTFHIED